MEIYAVRCKVDKSLYNNKLHWKIGTAKGLTTKLNKYMKKAFQYKDDAYEVVRFKLIEDGIYINMNKKEA